MPTIPMFTAQAAATPPSNTATISTTCTTATCTTPTKANPDGCHPVDTCAGHVHGEGCGHEAVPHGDHVDYIVNGRLHHQHGDHCDDHGPVEIVG